MRNAEKSSTVLKRIVRQRLTYAVVRRLGVQTNRREACTTVRTQDKTAFPSTGLCGNRGDVVAVYQKHERARGGGCGGGDAGHPSLTLGFMSPPGQMGVSWHRKYASRRTLLKPVLTTC